MAADTTKKDTTTSSIGRGVYRLPLVGTVSERSAAAGKDQRFVNCFPEVNELNEFYVVKRPGMTEFADHTPASSTARGIFSWRGNLYTVWGNKVHKNSSTTAITGSLAQTSGRVYFDETGGASSKLLIQEQHASNGAIHSLTSGDTLTNLNSADADIPDDQVAGVVNLDQYTCVMDADANVHNSDVGAEGTWLSTSFVNAEVLGDLGIRIARHVNYITAFGSKSVEFLYNAANAVGSPFSRLEGTVSLVGCPAGDSVVNIDDELVFVAESNRGGRFVAKIKGFTPEPISTKAIDESLDKEGSNITNAYAYSIRIMGHSFYVLTLPTTAAKTWVYDLTDGVWHEWTSDNGVTETYFLGYDATVHNGSVLIQGRNDGKVYTFDPATYQDDGNDINVLGQTLRFDGGVVQNKFLYRLEVVGDKQSSASGLTISYSDDDYGTFSTGRSADLNNERPYLLRLGSFQRRAFKYTHTANTPMRISEFELKLRTGHYGQ